MSLEKWMCDASDRDSRRCRLSQKVRKMTREEKIAKICAACIATDPGLASVGEPVQLRHILKAFRLKKLKYTIGSEGNFVGPASLVATTEARWQPLKNDLAMQDETCVDFLYMLFRIHNQN
jgi:hypothetical protein